MKFSVIIPAFNASATIAETLDAALNQSIKPYEILVYNDGSTDETKSIIDQYGDSIKAFHRPNGGVAKARNFLCSEAKGDVLAFLDADDVWHLRYLEVQLRQIQACTNAVAWFTNHRDLLGYGKAHFEATPTPEDAKFTCVSPEDFIGLYDRTPLSFQMSCCCVLRDLLSSLAPKPFFEGASGADDTYFHNSLPLLGSISYTSSEWVMYRITPPSISADRLKMSLLVLGALQPLEAIYATSTNRNLQLAFRAMVKSRYRNCGKFLMGAGKTAEARSRFRTAIAGVDLISNIKSICLLYSTYLPARWQPSWPSRTRHEA